MPMTMEHHADLLMINIRGLMARALLSRGARPTPEQLDMLSKQDLSVRELGDFFWALDYEVQLELRDMPDELDDI